MHVTSKGQVTILIEIRGQLGLHPGTEVELGVDGDAVRPTRARDGSGRGRSIVARSRGTATAGPTTAEIVALTRS